MLAFTLLFTSLPVLATAVPHDHLRRFSHLRRACTAKHLNSTIIQPASDQNTTSPYTPIFLTPNGTSNADDLPTPDPSLSVTAAATTSSMDPVASAAAAAAPGGIEALGQGGGADGAETVTVTVTITASTSTSTLPAVTTSGGDIQALGVGDTTATSASTTSSTIYTGSQSKATPVAPTPSDKASLKPTTPAPAITPPAASSSTAAAPSPSPIPPTAPAPAANAGSNQVGIGWNGQAGTQLKSFMTDGSKLAWYFDWDVTPTPGADGLEYVPMVWGPGSVPKVAGAVKSWPSGTNYVMSFNERKSGYTFLIDQL